MTSGQNGFMPRRKDYRPPPPGSVVRATNNGHLVANVCSLRQTLVVVTSNPGGL
jgi:hypothetical protein